MAQQGRWDRRSMLRGAAALAGAAAAAPLLRGVTAAAAQPGDADALFKAGHFEQAGRAYESILKTDPKNLNAARQRGYVALLSNRFAEAEKYLTTALDLAPGDKDTNYLLADCYLRQDKFALSVPRWQAIGEESYAKWFGAISGEAYQIHGDSARLPFQQMDPRPLVEASVNGGPPKRFSFYTGAPNLGVSATVAKEAGLEPVISQKVEYEDGVIWAHYGILESLKLGGLELRNLPVGWSTTESGEDTDSDSDGLLGTWVFYHLQPTFDYAGRALILRRPAPTATAKPGALPLWLAREQYLHSRGSFAGSGPRVLGVNLGGIGEVTAGMFGETAEQLGIRVDHDREIGTFGSSHPAVVYPCYPKEVRLGDAVARDVYCYTNPNRPVNVPLPYGTGFDTTGWLAHCFWKPFHVTLDFTGMNLYINPGPAAG